MPGTTFIPNMEKPGHALFDYHRNDGELYKQNQTMKFRFLPSILAILIYFICFWAFYEDEAASDGYTLIGFPLYFYTNSEGKFEKGYRPHFGFNAVNFFIDLLVFFLMIIVFNYLYKLIIKRRRA